ncbi:hypothetical protein MNBD_PLANCTO02-885, partial [hydrothermal vent metagenome]
MSRTFTFSLLSLRFFILTAICSLLQLGILVENSQAAHVYHVAPHGNDAHAGTIKKPFRTIQKGQDVVQKIIAKGLNTDVTVFLHQGTYRRKSPLIFDIKDSGTKKYRVTYSNYKNDKVVISGGREIKGWKQLSNGNWQVFLPEVKAKKWNFRELFVNGKRCIRARFPNKGYLRIEKAGTDRRTNFTFQPKDILLKEAGLNTELVFLHDWSISRVKVKLIDHKKNVLTVANAIGSAAKHYKIDHFEKHPRYYLENHISFLDRPGEWFLSRATGLLTYRPRKSEAIKKSSVVAPVLSYLLVVKGKATKPVQNIHFKGITFEHSNWLLPANGLAAVQAAHYEARNNSKKIGGPRVPIPAAVAIKDAFDCKFDKCEVKHLGGSGIEFQEGCKNCVVSNSLLADISANGIMVGHDCTGIQLKNNRVKNTGRQFFGSVGIWIGLANYITVANNKIHSMPYTGISVGWKWDSKPTSCHHNIIENNHIHHVMQTLSDGGGIYTLGRQPGSVLRKNQINSIPINAGRAGSNGIFMDQGSAQFLVEQNNIYDIAASPIRFNRVEE